MSESKKVIAISGMTCAACAQGSSCRFVTG
ncbi:hypothetical protein H4683_002259 [Filibacter limicola]|uniref:Uncharacterized protein n=1 Tax=Sporosarcina limicola TaxID=34101 RepID=A0A927MIS3_9BACL|nr:hypothetical protein [Sporosarcina limicola]